MRCIKYQAEYAIRTLDVIADEIPPRAHALVLEWASMHKMELLANWERAILPESLKPIAPLE